MGKKHKPPKLKRVKPSTNGHGRAFGAFRPRERLIYRYHDGRTDRRGDPLALIRGLTAYDGLAIDVDIKLAIGQTPEAMPALGRVVDATRAVFGLARLDDGGLTDAEALAVLLHFLTFVKEVQDDAGPLPPSPGPTGFPAANGSTTEHSSASGSTGSAS